MAVDKAVDSTLLNASCSYEANKIRAKLGSAAQITYDLANGKGFGDAIEAIPTGGGGSGATLVASGSFIGADYSGRMWEVPIGTKMAQTDFCLLVKAQDNSEFTQNSNYSFTSLLVTALSDLGYYDLSTVGNYRPFVSTFPVQNDNAGTITTKNSGLIKKDGTCIRDGNVSAVSFNTFDLYRTATGFTFNIGHSNSVYKFPSTVTYEWKVIYFGSNPSTDIITIS